MANTLHYGDTMIRTSQTTSKPKKCKKSVVASRLRVKHILAKLEVSMTDLAGMTGYSVPTISQVCNGHRSSRAARHAIFLAVRPLARRAGISVTLKTLFEEAA